MSQLTNANLKKFMEFYSTKMEGKKQTPTPSLRSRASSRSRSQSRGKSKSRARFSKGKSQKKRAMSAMGKSLRNTIKTSWKPIFEQKTAHEKKMALAKSGYFMDTKDNKTDLPSLQSLYDSLLREYQLAREAMRAGLKDRPIKLRLSVGMVLTTTITSGVTNTVDIGGNGNGKLDPTLCTEWSTIAALFDEYKVLGGEAEFLYMNYQTTTTVISNNIPIMAYEVDNGVAASSLALTQSSQHKTFPPLVQAGTVATGGSIPKHTFRWHVPKGTAIASATVAPGTEWISVALPLSAGYLQFYHVGAVVTATNTGAGWVYFDFEFRCRV